MIKGFMTTLGVLAALFTVFVIVPLVGFLILASPVLLEAQRVGHEAHQKLLQNIPVDNEDEAYDAKARAEYWEGQRQEHFEDVKLLRDDKRQHNLDPFQKRDLEERVRNWPDVLKTIEQEMDEHPDLKEIFKRDWKRREKAKEKTA